MNTPAHRVQGTKLTDVYIVQLACGVGFEYGLVSSSSSLTAFVMVWVNNWSRNTSIRV